jgi:hypothetical protein
MADLGGKKNIDNWKAIHQEIEVRKESGQQIAHINSQTKT